MNVVDKVSSNVTSSVTGNVTGNLTDNVIVVFVITWTTRDACTRFGNQHVNSK